MSLTIPQFEEQNWMCLRCYRVNSSYHTDDHCEFGCGYTGESRNYLSYDWKCPKCLTKNTTMMYKKCECTECHHKPESKELY